MKKMLICSIGSIRREATLCFAAEVAKALSAESTLLGIVARKQDVEPLDRALSDVAQDLAGQGLPARVRVEKGNAEAIVTAQMESTAYDLVAVGALGGSRSRRPLFESVGMRIVERAHGAVLLIKGERTSISRVLISASATELGRAPVRAGAALACGVGASATVLHVVDAMPAMYTGLEQMEETLVELLQSDSDIARELKWAAEQVKVGCVSSELKLRRGYAADEILREGQVGDHDLIVLGSSRYVGSIVRVLMGDLTREVVERAQRPVLVVPPSREAPTTS
jgi:nucleotide-binding universal stress UspA family protein